MRFILRWRVTETHLHTPSSHRQSPQLVALPSLGVQRPDVDLVDVVRVLQVRHGLEDALLPGRPAVTLHQVDVG